MKDRLEEKCAVFGIWGSSDAARQTYFGLFSLQHRGQEQSGIVTSDGEKMFSFKGTGLVSQIYNEDAIQSLKGNVAIGHNRYATSRGGGEEHAQPVVCGVVTTPKSQIAFAHNGNLPSVKKLTDFFEARGVNTDHMSDSELMAHSIDAFMQEGMDVTEAIKNAYPLWTGAFSCVILSGTTLIALRDQCGIRPLVMGKKRTENGQEIVFASETCALVVVGAEFEREILPGEMVVVSESGINSHTLAQANPKFDIFEFIYFARHESDLLGKSVYEVRKNLGKILAREYKIDADIIVPVPETATPAAIGYSQASGIPFEMALSKNRYINRTFIEPTQADIEQKLKMKFLPLAQTLLGKRVIVIDDSIVRGNTSKQIVKMFFDAGAKEVHLMSSSSKVMFPDFYGINTPQQKDLIASQKTTKEICDFVGATSVSYLSIDGMVEATGLSREVLSLSHFTGEYPIDILERKNEVTYELPNE
jgi:amidophosphoribosyltransferase